MRNGALPTRSILVALPLMLLACHRVQPASVSPTALAEEYRWWAVFRSALPVETVVARFGRAFTAIGMVTVAPTRLADTAWVSAHVSRMPEPGGGPVAARVVAYQFSDSTHFRTFVAGGTGAETISFCQEIARVAAVGTQAPRAPDGEEKLSVWRRWQ